MRNIGGNYILNLKQRQKSIKKPSTRIKQKKMTQRKYISEIADIFTNIEISEITMEIQKTQKQKPENLIKRKFTSDKENKDEPSNQKQLRKENITVIINNVAALSPHIGKLKDTIQWIQKSQCDIFLGQEANISFKHEKMPHYMATQWIPRYHMTISESNWELTLLKKPGGMFVIINEQY
jgi:hypothetical protein